MDAGNLGLPRKLDIWNTDQVFLTRTPTATPNSGVVNIGDGVFDGISTGKYAGSANGTYLAVNVTTGFSGDIFGFKLAGSNRLSLTPGGMLTGINFQFFGSFSGVYGSSYSNTTANAMFNVLGASTGSGSADGTAGSFSGSSSGTMFALNGVSTFTGNLFDVQLSGVNKFKIDISGNMTAAGQVNDSTGIGSAARLYEYYFYA